MPDELRPYQISDATFISKLPAAGLFNEQRTGKTPTALSALKEKGLHKILIVCPASAVYQWQEEYIRWMQEPCAVCIGYKAQRESVIYNWRHGLVISYDMLKLVKRGGIYVGDVLSIMKQDPDAVILDEAHRIRNHKTAAAQAAYVLSKIPYRLALTGTPTPNKAHEIWGILHFLYPNTFKSYWQFIDTFFSKHVQRTKDDRRYVEIGPLQKKMEPVLFDILQRISTNRKRKDVMTWLPDKDRITIRLPLTAEQAIALDELEQYYETGTVIVKGTLDRLIRYRQICLDPELLGLAPGSPKTRWLLQYATDYPERTTIIFSKFTSYLNKVQSLFPGSAIIVGATPGERRKEIVRAFQKGKIKLLFINLDAGKEALTLDTAEAIVFMDKFPPVGDISQAEDRFVSTTQDKADKLHIIYDLIMKDSYEEEIQRMITERYSETDIINNYRLYSERRKQNVNTNKL